MSLEPLVTDSELVLRKREGSGFETRSRSRSSLLSVAKLDPSLARSTSTIL